MTQTLSCALQISPKVKETSEWAAVITDDTRMMTLMDTKHLRRTPQNIRSSQYEHTSLP